MAWHTPIWHWLAYAAISGFVLLGLTGLALLVCRQPVQRLRLIQLTLLACLVVPALNRLPGLPQWSLGLLSTPVSPPESTADVTNPLVTADVVDTSGDTVAMASRAADFERIVPGNQDRLDGIVDPPPDATEASAAADLSTEPTTMLSAVETTPWPLARWIVIAYVATAGGLVLWWLIGLVKLLRFKRNVRPVPIETVEMFRELCGPRSKHVRLLASDHIDVPITYGWLRPAIVLPSRLCERGDTSELRYCLAHEWSHVERRDIRDWYLATLVKFLFFYQPVYWWLRRQLRLCQDYVADACAAEQAAVAEDYAEYLVQLSRRRLAAGVPAALGFADRRSHLFRRIAMLVAHPTPLERRCRWRWNLAITVMAVVVIAAVSAIRLEAGKSTRTKKAAAQEPAKPAGQEAKPKEAKQQNKKKRAGRPFDYSGKVTDRLTGKPIEGVTVNVWISLSSDPKTKERRELRELSLKTNAVGQFNFSVTADEDAQRSLYIEIEAQHPDYGPKGRGGYSHGMLKKNLKLGSPPWFSHLKLWPGKPITGVIETPEGKPAADVAILTYVKHVKAPRFSFGHFLKAKSDKDGRFRISVATPGEGVLWITPPNHVPTAHYVSKDNRGDWGRFVLQEGLKLKGKVYSAKGEPVQGILVSCRRRGDGVEEVDQFLGQNAVANHIGRSATSNEQGEFALADLPPGPYQIRVRRPYNQTRREPPQHVFVWSSLTLKEGEPPEPLEIRAVPHVEIHAQFLDSKRKPTADTSRGSLDGSKEAASSTRKATYRTARTARSSSKCPMGWSACKST